MVDVSEANKAKIPESFLHVNQMRLMLGKQQELIELAIEQVRRLMHHTQIAIVVIVDA